MNLKYSISIINNMKKLFENIEDFFFTIKMQSSDWLYNIGLYFKNLKRFRKILQTYESWDWTYLVKLNIFGLENLKNELIHEVDGPREKKKQKISELISLLNDLVNDTGYWNDEKLEGEEYNDEYAKRLWENHEKGFEEIHKIVVGQNPFKHGRKNKNKDKWFDGSGLTDWWD